MSVACLILSVTTMTEATKFVPVAGRLCVLGGVVGVVSGLVTAFIDPAVSEHWWRYPYTPAGFYLSQAAFLLNHVLLLAGVLGLAASGAVGPGRAGRLGVRLSVAGLVLLTACEAVATTLVDSRIPSRATDLLGAAFGVASILIGVGLITAGLAVVRAGRWPGWQRFTPLACGAAVFVIVLPGLFGSFLAGRLVITTWMVLFTALGLALLRPTLKGRYVS
jgi:hypothetical protein